MKKIVALVSFLVFVAACTTEPTTNNGTASNANKSMETKSTGVSEADITAKEKAAWETIEKKDYDGFGNLLASEYTEVTDDGVYDKAGIVAYVKDLNISDATFSDWKMRPIDKDAVALTYSVTLKATYKGQAVPPGPYRAGSAWVNRDGKWLAIFYQMSESKPMPPMPTPSASQPPKPAASSATKPADAGPDAAADEKLVWDAIKSRNYDAFAFYLAPDSVEIEADGIYDKAGSVKGVSMMDPSKFELSDWKTVKFDNDASLVTYIVKSPNSDHERHSTIWINRDGKWMALLHVGTPQAKPAAKPAARKM